MNRNLRPGKLPAALLRRLLETMAARDLIVGPGIGLDAAAIALPGPPKRGRYVVVAMDPITFVADETIGSHALTINLNDLATTGAIPRWFFVTLLFPAGVRVGTVKRTFRHLRDACRAAGILLCGGHTEITTAVERPVAVGCLLGHCRPKELRTSAGARVGDVLLLTKGIPVEAVAVLAHARSAELRRRYGDEFVERCRRYVTSPGISVLAEARAAIAAGGVHAMHDPTEGGLSAALYELAEAAAVGIRLEERALWVLPEGARLCEDYGLNPLGTLASGALVIAAAPGSEDPILRSLARAGIWAGRVGTVVPRCGGVQLLDTNGRLRRLPKFERDELARLFEREGRSVRRKAR